MLHVFMLEIRRFHTKRISVFNVREEAKSLCQFLFWKLLHSFHSYIAFSQVVNKVHEQNLDK